MKMHPERGDEAEVWRTALDMLQRANEDALFEIVQAIAKHVGVNDIKGLPVREFLIQRQREITERLLADYADTFPALEDMGNFFVADFGRGPVKTQFRQDLVRINDQIRRSRR